VSALACRLGVSREHLARTFRAEQAVSPKAWLASERIEAVPSVCSTASNLWPASPPSG